MAQEVSKQRLKEIANRYDSFIIDLAQMTSKLGEMKNAFEFMSNETGDNGDPAMLAEEALAKVGELLASVVLYAKDYKDEADGKIPMEE